MARYRITDRHYRDGRMHQPGAVVTLPESEQPNPAWEKVDDKPTEKHVPKEQPKKGGRPSDSSPI